MKERVALRRFSTSQAAELALAIRASSASVGVWMPWFHGDFAEHEAKGLIERYEEDFEMARAFNFGIFSLATGELLGGAALNQINRLHNFCNLCYWIRQDAQNQGFATRAVRKLARYGFEQARFTRLELVVAPGNEASERVARKAGAMFECRARNRLVLRDQPVDATMYSLLPGDL